MKKFKVGDLVRVKEATIDADLIGKVLPITEIYRDMIWVKGSKSSWTSALGGLEKVEPQYLKKGTRVKILVDRDLDDDEVTCRTGVIENEVQGLYVIRDDNGRYYVVKASDVEEIKEEAVKYGPEARWVCSSTAPRGAFTEGFDWVYRGIDNPTHIVDSTRYGYWPDTIKNSPKKGGKKSIMSGLKKATNFIRSLKQPLKNYVRLGWVELVEDEYVVTDSGQAYYMDVVFGLTPAKTLEEYAEKEVARIKKEEEGESE